MRLGQDHRVVDPLVGATPGASSALFTVFIVLHVIAALAGFGGVALSGVYGRAATDLGRDGALGDARRWFAAPNRLALAVGAVPVLAVAALVLGGREGEFGRAWVIAALVVWLGAAVTVVVVVRPAEARLGQLLCPVGGERPVVTEGAVPPAGVDVIAAAAAGRSLARGAAACDLAFFAALALMIWQPS